MGKVSAVWEILTGKLVQSDLTMEQEQELRDLLDHAHRVLSSLGKAPAIEDMDVLSTRSERAIHKWMTDYESWINDE